MNEGRADRDRIVAIGLFTADELLIARQALKRVYPVPSDGSFDALLREIDRAAREPSPRPRPQA